MRIRGGGATSGEIWRRWHSVWLWFLSIPVKGSSSGHRITDVVMVLTVGEDIFAAARFGSTLRPSATARRSSRLRSRPIHLPPVRRRFEAFRAPGRKFKRQLPETADQKRKVFKTVAAFATRDGGTVVFGMDPDELTVTGLVGEPRKLRDRLNDLVNGIVVPAPPFTIDWCEVSGETILVLSVAPGSTRHTRSQ
jgi:hypothetical protein